MNEPINSTQLIKIYFKCIDATVQYAADGNVTFTTEQILQTTYHAVSSAYFYNEACKEWQRKPEVNKTWVHFKQFFSAVYHDRKEQDKANTPQNNVHSANSAVDITQALDNLAMAAISDRDIFSQLTKINQQLTIINTNLSAQLHTVLVTNATLVAKINAATTASTTATPSIIDPSAATSGGQQPPFDRAAWTASLNTNGYCCSHGYRVVTGHDRSNCKGKLLGHVNAATRTDIMGGSTRENPN